jgi:hypothetical protein
VSRRWRWRHFTEVFECCSISKVRFLRSVCHSSICSLKKVSYSCSIGVAILKARVNLSCICCYLRTSCRSATEKTSIIVDITRSSYNYRGSMFVHISCLPNTLSRGWIVIWLMNHCPIHLIFFGQAYWMKIILPECTVTCYSRSNGYLRQFILLGESCTSRELILLKVWAMMMVVPCSWSDLLRETWLRFTVNSTHVVDSL